MLSNKIDFVLFIDVTAANPNGDPLSGNMPRQDNNLHGIMSDVCIKRKIRNRLQDAGEPIFVVANDRIEDGVYSLQKRFQNVFGSKKNDGKDTAHDESCKRWTDVRAFGQTITFNNLSIGIRGPVSISLAKSLDPVDVTTMQITRSTNGMEASVDKQRSSDTMGSKHYVEYGLYKVCGSINPYFAERTGFSEEDAEKIKEALRTLLVNDVSSARPDGSMEVKKLYWVKHPSKLGTVSSAKVHQLFNYKRKDEDTRPVSFEDYIEDIDTEMLKDLENKGVIIEEIEGM